MSSQTISSGVIGSPVSTASTLSMRSPATSNDSAPSRAFSFASDEKCAERTRTGNASPSLTLRTESFHTVPKPGMTISEFLDLEEEEDSVVRSIPRHIRRSSIAAGTVLSTEQNKQRNERKRKEIAAELVSNENEYYANLYILTAHFMQPMVAMASKLGETKARIKEVFGDVETIRDFHHMLLTELEICHREGGCIAGTFLSLAPALQMYTKYVARYESALATIRRLKKNKHFAAFLKEKRKKRSLTKSLMLHDFLIMPVQRIPRYEVLFQQLLKYTEKDHPGWSNTRKVLSTVNSIATKINEQKRELERRNQIMAIESLLLDFDTDLSNPDRILIRQGQLTRITKEDKRTYLFFLFNDILLWCTKNFHFRGIIKLAFNVVSDVKENDLGLHLAGPDQALTLQATTQVAAQHWKAQMKECVAWSTSRMKENPDIARTITSLTPASTRASQVGVGSLSVESLITSVVGGKLHKKTNVRRISALIAGRPNPK